MGRSYLKMVNFQILSLFYIILVIWWLKANVSPNPLSLLLLLLLLLFGLPSSLMKPLSFPPLLGPSFEPCVGQTYLRWYMFGLFFFSSKPWFHFEFMLHDVVTKMSAWPMVTIKENRNIYIYVANPCLGFTLLLAHIFPLSFHIGNGILLHKWFGR